MTKNDQLHVGLIVCEAVLESLIRTHPNKEVLRRELTQTFSALQISALAEESLGEQGEAHMQASMEAFLSQLGR